MSAPIITAEPGKAVALLRSEADGWRTSPVAPAGFWPAWRPGHDAISLSVLVSEGRQQRSAVEMLDLQGNHLRSLYESPLGGEAVIAPNVPHYALWSPTGEKLALVAQGRAGLTLFLSEADGPLIADPIQTGAPLFLAWSPDGSRLAVHSGVNLSVLELAEARASRPISADARGFRTPAFSDDGELLAFATPDGGGDGVIVQVATGAGDATEAVGEFPGGVALAFRPGTRTLSVAVDHAPGIRGLRRAVDRRARRRSPGAARAPALLQRPLGSHGGEARVHRSLGHGRRLRLPPRARRLGGVPRGERSLHAFARLPDDGRLL